MQQWATGDASPSGLAVAGTNIFIANLQGGVIRLVPTWNTNYHEDWFGGHGRLRAITVGPDGNLWYSTSNRDGRGSPNGDDDLVIVAVLG